MTRQRSILRTVLIALKYLLVLVYALACLFPVYWMVSLSLKSVGDILVYPPVFTFEPTLANYQELLAQERYRRYFVNSFMVAPAATALAVILGSMAGYSLARFRIGGRILPFCILATRMFPPMVVALPIFILAAKMGLLDTRIALTLLYTTFFLPFVIWLMRGFFLEIPAELEEAAYIDGASRFGALWRVILPLAVPGVVVTTIFVFMWTWNEFLFSVILMSLNKTAPVAAADFYTDVETLWGPMAAAGVLITGPMLLLAILVQRYIVRGLTLGAVKG